MLQCFDNDVVIRTKSSLTTSYVAGPVSPITDSGNTDDTNQDFTTSGGAVDKEWLARTFTATSSDEVVSVAATLGKTGAPAGTTLARIFTDSNGLPSLPVGDVSDTVTNTDLSANAGGASQTFTWTSGYPVLVSGSDYWLVLQTSDYAYTDTSTEVRWRTDANGAVAASECAKYESDASPAWTVIGTDVGADFTVTYRDALVGLGSANQVELLVDFTVGSSAGCRIKVEFSADEGASWYQETKMVLSGDDMLHTVMTHRINATSPPIISIPVMTQLMRVSVQAITNATNAEVGITATTGLV